MSMSIEERLYENKRIWGLNMDALARCSPAEEMSVVGFIHELNLERDKIVEEINAGKS